jgi:uncharacterized protein DUF541
MRIRRRTLATRGTLIVIGAVIAIAASAVTAIAVRAGPGSTPAAAPLGAGSVAGPRDTVTVVGEGTQQHAVGDDIQLNGISLLLSDNTTQLKGARQTAMAAAAARAKEWATLAGRHLGKVLSVSEIVSNGSPATPCYGGCGGGSGGPVQAGSINVTVDVAVVYELTD